MKISFPKQRPILILALFLMAAFAHADPENFMVDEFTFVRPPAWKWVWEEKRTNIGLFLDIPGGIINDTVHVYFRIFKGEEGSPENRTKAWRLTFKESADSLKVRTETRKVGAFTVIYIEMEGTSAHEIHPDYGLFAAVVKMKEGHLVIRMSGRKKVIDNSKRTFREMVERALKERESE
ncbi:MAG: hypothetical protein JWM68_5211 [Verrucomicrobiales bacterium]|nr:hypothetical protein [Verrucomicrobiales bacterium]